MAAKIFKNMSEVAFSGRNLEASQMLNIPYRGKANV